jgi:hypothetical protein
MSSFKWGDTDLMVINGSYYPPHAKANIEVIELIPSLDNTTPNSVLQMGGRSRIETPAFTILVYTFDELNALFADDLNKTVRTFTDPYGLTMQAILKDVEPINWRYDQVYEVKIVVMEA